MMDWRHQEDGLETGPMEQAAALDEPLATPWARWCARLFDLWWEVMLVAVVAGYILGQTSPTFLRWMEMPGGAKVFSFLCIPVALLLDAVLHASFGNTPGKALLGLRIAQTDGRPLTLKQQAWRNLGVWSAGLGLALPLVNLFAMARQYGRLKKGEHPAYDEEGYRVRARPIGWVRRTGFGLAFAALFVAMVGLDMADKADSRKMTARLNAPLFTWTNPETGLTARITPEWQHTQETGADGMVVHRFLQHTEHAVVVMTSEQLDGMSLVQYARALTDSLADEWKIPGGYLEDFQGHPSWIASGERDGGSVRIQIRLVQAAGKAWRVTAIQAKPMEYTDDLVHSLNTKLWRTVVPD